MGTIEQKYVFIATQQTLILDWLQHLCLPDPHFPGGVVSTIYFDTPRLHFYQEKRNGDYLKSKVRLRWYPDGHTPAGGIIPGFLEIKRRVGVFRQKERLEIPLSSDWLRQNPFQQPVLLALPDRAKTLDPEVPEGLYPLLHVQYRRRRFVDPHSGARLALDTDITCLDVNRDFVAGIPPVRLDAGVLEFKSAQTELPPHFAPLGPYLTREAFSKYARCWEHLQQPLGRVV